MRGEDGSDVNVLEPHIAHSNNEQPSGRPPRRSARRESAASQSSSQRVDRLANARAGGATNIAAQSSIDVEGGGTAARGIGEGSDGAAMRGGDGGGLSALENLPVVPSVEPESRRPSRRSVRRENSAHLPSSSSHRGESNLNGKGTDGPVRNGFSVNGATTSSMRAELPARAQRVLGVGGVRDRGSRRARVGAPSRPVGMDANGVANGFHQSSLAVHEEDQPEGSPRERVGEYFPQIHDEVGLQCLTRMPRYKIYQMAMVCKKWKEYLLSPDLYKARRLLGVREDWVFILGTNVEKNWRAFLPEVGEWGEWVVLPPCPSDYTFDSCDKESMVAGLNLLVLGQNKDGYVIWKFDTIKSEWSTTPRMHSDRCMFGSASFGKYAYFAGGTSRGTVLKSVERYDSETNSWELLAEMKHNRKACSGFVMDGKFHVIGGHVLSNIISTGEAYDPQTGTWSAIEGMWPQEFVPSTSVSPPLVAVLNNELYAINIIQNMLMLYNKQENVWQMLEKVPFRAENTNGWGLGFKAVGDELYVIGGAGGPRHFLPKIHAYRPRVDGGETWRLVTDLNIPTNGFIYNCAVMSG